MSSSPSRSVSPSASASGLTVAVGVAVRLEFATADRCLRGDLLDHRPVAAAASRPGEDCQRPTAAINGWSLKWTFANGQVITQLWNGVVAQSGANVTVTNADYNRAIPAGGGTAEVGFLANWTGTNTKPTAFTLNGSACTTG